MLKKFLYSRPITGLLYLFCRLFYPKQYLSGRYFTEKRAGYLWALRSIPRRLATGIPFPIGKTTVITGKERITFHPDSLHVFQSPGCYFQAIDGNIMIGRNVHIAPNVGLITTNHNVNDPSKHVPGEDIVLGDDCWIGMNSVILPGITLGPHTVVGAGAVVTKSFPEGYCILGGVPAKVLKILSPDCEVS